MRCTFCDAALTFNVGSLLNDFVEDEVPIFPQVKLIELPDSEIYPW